MTSVDELLKYTPKWWAAEWAAYQELTSTSNGCTDPNATAHILDKMVERRRQEWIETKKLAEDRAAAAEEHRQKFADTEYIARREKNLAAAREASAIRRVYWLSPAGIEEKRLIEEKNEAQKLAAREKLIELKMAELRKKEEEAEIEAEARRRLAALVPRERLIELKMAELRKKEEEAEIEAEAISRLGLAAIFTP